MGPKWPEPPPVPHREAKGKLAQGRTVVFGPEKEGDCNKILQTFITTSASQKALGKALFSVSWICPPPTGWRELGKAERTEQCREYLRGSFCIEIVKSSTAQPFPLIIFRVPRNHELHTAIKTMGVNKTAIKWKCLKTSVVSHNSLLTHICTGSTFS